MTREQASATLYIDHQIIANETNWTPFSNFLATHNFFRLVFSIYNLIEISAATDKAQAVRRVEFIDSLKPAWVLERLIIEKNEVRNFVWEHYFSKQPCAFSALTDHLSTALSYHLGPKVSLGMNARKWLGHFVNVDELNPVKKLTVDFLVTLQAADKKQKQRIEANVFRAWVMPKLPMSDPDGGLLTKAEMANIAEFCWSTRTEFYLCCPAMFAEHCLCKARTADAKRMPKESDMLDLQHTTVGLSYCDVLVTQDRYVYQCAVQAKKLLPRKSAEIYRSIDELAVIAAQGQGASRA